MSKVLCYDADGKAMWVDKRVAAEKKPPKTQVSAALGCTLHSVDEMREDARINGFSAIEFKPDPALIEGGVPLWYDCHCSSPDQLRRYQEHCRLTDKNNGGSSPLSIEDLATAEELARRAYPVTERPCQPS